MTIVPTQAQFIQPLECLFKPKRFKVLYGGRGAGRSWAIARALLIKGQMGTLRVLCVRELQKSIEDSVHKLLSDQIEILGLGGFYEIQKAKIIGRNGTVFSFEGIKNNTTAVKSYEGIDICWAEEAAKISRSSWGVLIPTIRKAGSEIWMSFNPELATDYTYTRWVLDPDLKPDPLLPQVKIGERSYIVRMTYHDNPWFPEDLRLDLEQDKKRDHDYYLNVWEGHCLVNLEGAVYAKELRSAQEDGRITRVDYDRDFPVDTFWDLGKSDATCIWFAQKINGQYRILDYFEETGGDVPGFLKMLQNKSYVYGTHYLPHDAKAKRLGTKRTIEEQIRLKYPDGVKVLDRLAIVDGINAARMIFPNCWFDEVKCADGIDVLRHYCYKITNGQRAAKPEHCDGADAFRYLALALKGGSVNEKRKQAADRLSAAASLDRLNQLRNPQGWMGR